MATLLLHHASIVVRDLPRAVEFYMQVFDLPRLQRPPFKTEGAWIGVGDRQVHLIVYPQGTFRTNPRIDINDAHFAFRTDDFAACVKRLEAMGFHEDAAEDDPKRLFINRHGLAGFDQLYILDPDLNIVEINAAPM
jgi:catechol 2,3-dioxygenase-like lactoylglutathione lyase family enzyme